MKINQLWRVRGRASASTGFSVFAGIVLVCLAYATTVYAQHRMPGEAVKEDRNHPWMNASLSPDERAAMVLKEPISTHYWAGVALILAGLIVISRAPVA